jgi:ribonuclease D
MPKSLPNTELVWVDQPQPLRQAAEELAAEDILAVDTESNSLYAYQEQVCLIQFSTRRKDYLIDAMVLPDLSPLAGIFSSERILKVFHAAEYDLICLFRDHGFQFNFIFDTMMAARILGYKKTGLGSLLADFFGIEVNKKYQTANWGKRPLKPDMLAYARQDSHYLIPLQDKLRAELLVVGLWELALEDFERLTRGIQDTTESSEDDFWKLHGARDLSPEKAAVLKALYQFRESEARAQNRPPFKILSNQALVEMAETCPLQPTDLLKVPALHENQAKRYGRGLAGSHPVRSTRTAFPSPQPSPPTPNHTRSD